MKVIFLDIDGVLNNGTHTKAMFDSSINFKEESTDITMRHQGFDPISIRFIRKLIKETGAVVVVSSTWRGNWTSCQAELMHVNIDVIDRTTKVFDFSLKRGDEIKDWLLNRAKRTVQKFIIIDDDNDMLESQQEFFVECDPQYGFKKDQFDKALELLK